MDEHFRVQPVEDDLSATRLERRNERRAVDARIPPEQHLHAPRARLAKQIGDRSSVLVEERCRQMEFIDRRLDAVEDGIHERAVPVRDERAGLGRTDKPRRTDLRVAPSIADGRVIDRTHQVVHPRAPGPDGVQPVGFAALEGNEQFLARLEATHGEIA